MSIYLTEPPAGAVVRLKVVCGSCYHLMSELLQDPDGGLWLWGTDRLRDPDRGEYWTSRELVPADGVEWLRSDCSKHSSPECGWAYSWSLDEYRKELAKARATGKPVTIRR